MLKEINACNPFKLGADIFVDRYSRRAYMFNTLAVDCISKDLGALPS